jgi:hypothetical protein
MRRARPNLAIILDEGHSRKAIGMFFGHWALVIRHQGHGDAKSYWPDASWSAGRPQALPSPKVVVRPRSFAEQKSAHTANSVKNPGKQGSSMIEEGSHKTV